MKLKDLAIGACFKYDDSAASRIFMKTYGLHNGKYYCVDLSSGELYKLRQDRHFSVVQFSREDIFK